MKMKGVLFLGVYLLLLVNCQDSNQALFVRESPSKTGVNFKNTIVELEGLNVLNYPYFYNGGGVAIGDVNNDGLQDIYFTGNLVSSHLYLNKGDFKFENIAEQAGVKAEGFWNTGVTMADINADGWLDIYICRSAAADAEARRNLLFINNGPGENNEISFTEKGRDFGLADPSYSTHSCFFDLDRDGDLDMFLLNHSVPEFANFNSRIGHLKDRSNPNYGDKLFRNDGDKFVDITEKSGILTNVLGFGLGVAVSDFNDDNWMDIYISNDFNEEDYLYINNQDGTFTEALDQYLDHTSMFSMGSDAADINNDGKSDLITLDMLPEDNYRIKLTSGPDNFNKYQLLLKQDFYPQNMRNMMHINQGNGKFSEVGQLSGISNSDWSWSALFADYDLDGYQDLFVSNGNLRDYTNMDFLNFAMNFKIENPEVREEDIPIEEVLKHMPKVDVPNKVYKNKNGISFEDKSTEWGFVEPELSNGAAYADLDNDGDLDIVVNNINEEAGIYRNTAMDKKRGHFAKIQLHVEENPYLSVGTGVTIYSGNNKWYREMNPSRGFQSAVEPLIHFGFSDSISIDSLIVEWSNGNWEKFESVQLDQLNILNRGRGKSLESRSQEPVHSIFEQSDLLMFKHKENIFNDFGQQSLLIRFLSRQGPPITVGDINNDGIEDMVIGAAAGESTEVKVGNLNGGFTSITQEDFEWDTPFEDTDLNLVDIDKDSDLDLLIASGGNTYLSGDDRYCLRSYSNDGNGRFQKNQKFPCIKANASTVKTGDFNGDGKIDIFLGSSYQSLNYPLPDSNFVLFNQGDGSFVIDKNLPFELVNVMAADVADIDNDGIQDIILSGEWEPIQVWSYIDGNWKLKYKSEQKGWYTSVRCVNLDADPSLEIVAGNWGWNSQLSASPQNPLVLYHGDFDNNGTVDPILSCFNGDESYPFVSRDDIIGQLPVLKKLFTNYHDYAQYKMSDLLPHLDNYSTDTVSDLSSGVFDLVDGRLIGASLPIEAQVAPVFSILPIDYDKDGDLDLILTGNSRFNRVKLGEIDANHGILLENQGDLNFVSVPNRESGLNLRGEVRSAVLYRNNMSREFLVFGINDQGVEFYKIVDPSVIKD